MKEGFHNVQIVQGNKCVSMQRKGYLFIYDRGKALIIIKQSFHFMISSDMF